jgi:PAS domain S-box-containing protein
LLLDNFTEAGAFTPDAQALIMSLAQQTALTLENAGLYRASEQRAGQLQALANAGVVLTATLEQEALAAEVLKQLGQVLQFDTGTLWMRQGSQMVVRAAYGFADDDERIGLSVSVEDSLLLNEMARTGRPIVVGDVRQDARFATLIEHPHPSWLGVPLIAGREVTGVIALEKEEANFYHPEQVLIAATFAGQAAAAMENAGLYAESVTRAQELDQRSQRLALLNQLSAELSATLDPGRILESTLENLLKLVSCSGAAAVLFGPTGEAWVQVEAGLDSGRTAAGDLPLPLPPAPLFDRLRETLGIYQAEGAVDDPELAPLGPYLAARGARSLLALPLATGQDLHGLILAFTAEPRRFTAEEVGLARTIANQAAVGVQNARLYAETRSLSEDLERRVTERTAQLGREHHRTQTMLKVLTELSSSLDLEHVLNRTLKELNEIVDAEHISVLILRPGEKKLYQLASIGYTHLPPDDRRVTGLDPEESLAGWVISKRQSALIADVRSDSRWKPYDDLDMEAETGELWDHRSAIGVPLMAGAEVLGALLFFHPQPDHFSADQVDLVEAVARQVAVAVNNAELYRLIRDQAEDLGSMLRRQQVETSRTRAMLEAVADGVLVTDAERKITLFNASAEKILGLGRDQVVSQSLEDFLGLFGRAAQAWVEKIHTWSQDPASYRPGDVYAEQFTLEDGRVVSVHLAPVQARKDRSAPGERTGAREFLGTVSIFQDITHQVEVDRLKSEFVATVSHELRTPMTSIKGYVEVLLMGAAGPVSDQQSRFLNIVKDNTERLAVLVNDLLDISRIESGRAVLSLQSVDLKALAGERVAEVRRRSEEAHKRLEVELEAAPALPPASGDAERVRQILDNLLENAFLYTAEGGRILVRLHPTGNELQIDVQDTGIGISPELQPRVFERFYRGEHPFVLASSGTGLGLAIVKHLVEMHGGRIWLKSSGLPGEGSTFSFTLPIFQGKG